MLSVSYYPIVFGKWSVIKTIQAYILGGAEGIIFEHLFYFFLAGKKCEKHIWLFSQ